MRDDKIVDRSSERLLKEAHILSNADIASIGAIRNHPIFVDHDRLSEK